MVLHPPQELFVESFQSKGLPLDGQIHFMFVGNEFFRKGGGEILETFQDARRNRGYNIKLTIISSLRASSYAVKTSEQDIEVVKDTIHRNSDWIDFYSNFPNEDVLERMKSAHIGLLPTHADSYGYAALEYQASGCPVISTNVRALPEINNNEVGWLIEVPKGRMGEAAHVTEEQRSDLSLAIRNGLTGAIEEIMENRQVILQKSDASLQRIREHHSPEDFSRKLGEVYDRALN